MSAYGGLNAFNFCFFKTGDEGKYESSKPQKKIFGSKHRFCWLTSKHTSVKGESKVSHQKYLNVYIYLTHSMKNGTIETQHRIWTCIIVSLVSYYWNTMSFYTYEQLYFHPPKTHTKEKLTCHWDQFLNDLFHFHVFTFLFSLEPASSSFYDLYLQISSCRLAWTILNMNTFWKGIRKTTTTKKKPCLVIWQLVDHVVVRYEFPLDSEVSVEESVPRQVLTGET